MNRGFMATMRVKKTSSLPTTLRYGSTGGASSPQPSLSEEEREGVSTRFGEYGRAQPFGRVRSLPP
jgi:hypothetical protein